MEETEETLGPVETAEKLEELVLTVLTTVAVACCFNSIAAFFDGLSLSTLAASLFQAIATAARHTHITKALKIIRPTGMYVQAWSPRSSQL